MVDATVRVFVMAVLFDFVFKSCSLYFLERIGLKALRE